MSAMLIALPVGLGVLGGCASGARRPAPEGAPAPATTRLPGSGAKAAPGTKAGAPAGRTGPPTVNAPGARATPPAGGATLSAALLGVNVARVMTYDPTEGEGTRALVVVRDEPPNCYCAGRSWWERHYHSKAEGTAFREVHLTIDVNGYVAVLEEINREEKVEVVFVPALVVVPHGMPAATSGQASFTQDLRMTVHPLGDRSKVRSEGAARLEMRYAGDEPVATGAGVFTARKLVSTFTADLGPAKVTSASDEWYADNIGLVARREREVTRALGVVVRDNATGWVLASFRMTP